MRYFWLIIVAMLLIVPGITHGQEEEAAPEEAAEEAPVEAPAPGTLRDIRQVQIQVWISETGEQGLRDIGANLNYTRFVRGVEETGSVQQVTSNLFNPIDDFDRVTLPAPSANPPSPPFFPANENPAFDDPLRPDEEPSRLDGIQTRSGFGMTASILESGSGTIDAVFRGIERKSDVDLISKPELLVMDQQPAYIKAGGEVPYQDVAYDNKGNPQLSVKWRDIGVNLTLTPQILNNDFVRLQVDTLEVTDIERIENIRGVDLPVFSKRSQTGVIHVPDKQTLVIGGLSSRVVRRSEKRVPVLGALPILGFPFRSRDSEANQTHLLIFVSPTIVDLRNLSGDVLSALNFWKERGSEWANSDRIQAEVEAMEFEL